MRSTFKSVAGLAALIVAAGAMASFNSLAAQLPPLTKPPTSRPPTSPPPGSRPPGARPPDRDGRSDADSVLLSRPQAPRASSGMHVWLAGGLGPTGSEKFPGFARVTQIAVQHNANVFLVRQASVFEIGFESQDRDLDDFGFLYGRGKFAKRGHLFAAAGVGSFNGGCDIVTLNVKPPCSSRASVPVTLEAITHLGNHVGLGGQLFGNINSRESMAGITFMLQFGWFGENRTPSSR